MATAGSSEAMSISDVWRASWADADRLQAPPEGVRVDRLPRVGAVEQPLGFLDRDGGRAAIPPLGKLADQVVQGRGDLGGDSPELESERVAPVDDLLGGEAADAAHGLGEGQQE